MLLADFKKFIHAKVDGNQKVKDKHISDIVDSLSYKNSDKAKAQVLSALYLLSKSDRKKIRIYAKKHKLLRYKSAKAKKPINKELHTLKESITQLETRIETPLGDHFSYSKNLQKISKRLSKISKKLGITIKDDPRLKKVLTKYMTHFYKQLSKINHKKTSLRYFIKKSNKTSEKLKQKFFSKNLEFQKVNREKAKKFRSEIKKIGVNNLTPQKLKRLKAPYIFRTKKDMKRYFSDLILDYFFIQIIFMFIQSKYIPVFFHHSVHPSRMQSNGCWFTALRTILINSTGDHKFGLRDKENRNNSRQYFNNKKSYKMVTKLFDYARGLGGKNYKYIKNMGFENVNTLLRKKGIKNRILREEDFNAKNISEITKAIGPIYLSMNFEIFGHAYVIHGAYKDKIYLSDYTFNQQQISSSKIVNFFSEGRVKYKRLLAYTGFISNPKQRVKKVLLKNLLTQF